MLKSKSFQPLLKSRAAIASACTLFLLVALSGTTVAQTGLKMKALVVTVTTTEPGYEGIASFLQYVDLPFDTLVASQQPLTAEILEDSNGGHYQAVFLTSDSLGFAVNGRWESAFDPEEWQILWDYEAKYGVRQVTYFTFPGSRYGLGLPTAVSTEQEPLMVSLTAAGQEVFPYLQPDAAIPIRYAYTYLAAPLANSNTTALVEDGDGNAIVSLHTTADGRENLAVTCDNWRYLLHSQLLSYGIIHWATRGVHLGERSVYLMPHVDDIFLPNFLFDSGTGSVNEQLTYRINSEDMMAVESWQDGIRSLRNPNFQDFSLTMVFNGWGAQDKSDSLVRYFGKNQDRFLWVSHTYSHPNLDHFTYTDAFQEVQLNHKTAKALKLKNYKKSNLVTGEISGLSNPDAMKAVADFGIRYVVSNTSVAGQDNPTPNTGIVNMLDPRILEIPRRPTNIFYPVSTVEEEVGLYNVLYHSFWGRDLTYEEILDFESDLVLSYMASYDMDPLMFHQSNLRAYDGKHFLLGDMIEAVIDKYSRYMNLPVLTPAMDKLGERMAQRMQRLEAGVQATWFPNQGIRISAERETVVAVTGIQVGKKGKNDTFKAGTFRVYGGVLTSWIKVKPGTPLWIGSSK